MKQITRQRTPLTLTACLFACGLMACTTGGFKLVDSQIAQPTPETTSSVIVQGQDMDLIKQLVLEVGGTVTHELAIIRAVGVKLTATQQTALQELDPNLRLYEDAGVRTNGNNRANNDNDDGLQ